MYLKNIKLCLLLQFKYAQKVNVFNSSSFQENIAPKKLPANGAKGEINHKRKGQRRNQEKKGQDIDQDQEEAFVEEVISCPLFLCS